MGRHSSDIASHLSGLVKSIKKAHLAGCVFFVPDSRLYTPGVWAKRHVIPKSPLTDLVSCPLFGRCVKTSVIVLQSAAVMACAYVALPKFSFISTSYEVVKNCAICW